MDSDRFGVPYQILGPHSEDFYSVMGRIVTLSAVLEHQARSVLQTMTNSLQSSFTTLYGSDLPKKALEQLANEGGDPHEQILSRYFRDVGETIERRNHYVHNLWPAQACERVYGWRSPQARKPDPQVDKPDVFLETNPDGMRAFILELVELIQRRPSVLEAAREVQEPKLYPDGPQ